MSLRARLKEDRYAVGGVPEVAGARGLRWRLGGPTADEHPAVTHGRALQVTLRAVAWNVVLVLGVFLLRLALLFPPQVVAFVLVGAVLVLAAAAFVNYLRGRAGRARPRLAVTLAVGLCYGVQVAAPPAAAVFIVLPVAAYAAFRTAAVIARQFAMWMTENPDAPWDARDRYQEAWAALPSPGLPVAVGCALAAAAYILAARREAPAQAATFALAVFAVVLLAGAFVRCDSPGALLRVSWQGLVLWYGYNRHGYPGPLTFQFEGRFRAPAWRSAAVSSAAVAVATAVLAGCLPVPRADLAPVYRAAGIGSAGTGPGADRPPAAQPLRPHETAYLAELPPREREDYLRRRETDRTPEGSGRAAAAKAGVVTWIGRLGLLLVMTPLLLAAIYMGTFGPALVEYHRVFEEGPADGSAGAAAASDRPPTADPAAGASPPD